MLEILITHRDEDNELVIRLLRSIATQPEVDFSGVLVTVCNDGHERPLSISDEWPFAVRYYETEHGGVSHARKSLLENAVGDYVMFCDCDDEFIGELSLRRILNDADGCDIVSAAFIQENEDGTTQVCMDRPLMVHGKAFRRKFLKENGITFNEDLVVSGDAYFLWQTKILARSTNYVRTPSYVWKYNAGSVSRGHDNHDAKVLWRHIESDGLLFDRFSEIGRPIDAETFAIRVLLVPYFVMDSEQWRGIEGSFESELAVRRLSWWLRHTKAAFDAIQPFRVKNAYKRLKSFYGRMPFDGYDGLRNWRDDIMRLTSQP